MDNGQQTLSITQDTNCFKKRKKKKKKEPFRLGGGVGTKETSTV